MVNNALNEIVSTAINNSEDNFKITPWSISIAKELLHIRKEFDNIFVAISFMRKFL